MPYLRGAIGIVIKKFGVSCDTMSNFLSQLQVTESKVQGMDYFIFIPKSQAAPQYVFYIFLSPKIKNCHRKQCSNIFGPEGA